MKRNNPEMWRRFLLLMDHDEERKLETDYQEMFQVSNMLFLQRSVFKMFVQSDIFTWLIIGQCHQFSAKCLWIGV